jgi:hypothetical protein
MKPYSLYSNDRTNERSEWGFIISFCHITCGGLTTSIPGRENDNPPHMFK